MRQRAVGAGCDDRRERGAFGSEVASALLDGPGHLALLAAGQARLGEPRVDRVAQLAAAADQRDLVGVLDGAEILDDLVAGHELGARCPGGLVQRLPGGVGERRGLEPDALGTEDLGEAGGDIGEQGLLGDVDLPVLGQRPDGGRVAEVRHEPVGGAEADEPVRSRVAGQVAHVGRCADQEPGQLALGEHGLEAVAAGDEVHAARSCSQSSAAR